MKKLLLCALIASFLISSCKSSSTKSNSSAVAANSEQANPKPVPPKSEGSIRVLFVGNSHTEYYASFPKMLEALTKENGKQVEVYTLLEMGVSIDEVLSANKADADKMFAQKDADGNYFDYVILQESTPVAIQDEDQFLSDSKAITDLISVNSPKVAIYMYELAFPDDYTSSNFKSYQPVLSENTTKVAKSLPNAGVLPFATVLGLAYQGDEGYVAKKDGKDLLRYTDKSRHMLNDGVFLNSLVLYKTLFGEMPKIPKQLPLATGTGDDDDIENMDVSRGVSNPEALVKIAASYN